MDPIEQMLAQGRIGSAGPGPSPQFQAFEQGVQNSLSKRRIDQDQQKIDAEMQMLPLKIHEMQQRERMNSLTLQKQAWQQQDMTDSAEDFLKLGVDLDQVYKAPEYDPLKAASLLSSFGVKHPGATAMGVLKPLEEQAKVAETYALRKQTTEATIKSLDDRAAERNANLAAIAAMNAGSREKVAGINAEARLAAVMKKQSDAQRLFAPDAKLNHLQELYQKVLQAPTPEARADAIHWYDEYHALISKASNEGKTPSEATFITQNYDSAYVTVTEQAKKDGKTLTPTEARDKTLELLKRDLQGMQGKPKSDSRFLPSVNSKTNKPPLWDPNLGKFVPQ